MISSFLEGLASLGLTAALIAFIVSIIALGGLNSQPNIDIDNANTVIERTK